MEAWPGLSATRRHTPPIGSLPPSERRSATWSEKLLLDPAFVRFSYPLNSNELKIEILPLLCVNLCVLHTIFIFKIFKKDVLFGDDYLLMRRHKIKKIKKRRKRHFAIEHISLLNILPITDYAYDTFCLPTRNARFCCV